MRAGSPEGKFTFFFRFGQKDATQETRRRDQSVCGPTADPSSAIGIPASIQMGPRWQNLKGTLARKGRAGIRLPIWPDDANAAEGKEGEQARRETLFPKKGFFFSFLIFK